MEGVEKQTAIKKAPFFAERSAILISRNAP